MLSGGGASSALKSKRGGCWSVACGLNRLSGGAAFATVAMNQAPSQRHVRALAVVGSGSFCEPAAFLIFLCSIISSLARLHLLALSNFISLLTISSIQVVADRGDEAVMNLSGGMSDIGLEGGQVAASGMLEFDLQKVLSRAFTPRRLGPHACRSVGPLDAAAGLLVAERSLRWRGKSPP